jgi:hypothetical protein
MTEFRNLAELAAAFENALDRPICVEGFPGAGKSFVANCLSIMPPRSIVRIDSFVAFDRHSFSFIEHVERDRLNCCIRSALNRVVVEGVLARRLIDEDLLGEFVFVYVKCVDKNSRWHDGLSLDDPRPAAFLHDEVFDYHHEFLPHKKADFAFVRQDLTGAR